MADSEYIPNYAPGEILVEFSESCGHPTFVETLMKANGYTVRKTDEPCLFSVETPIGEEQAYSEKIESEFKQYIDWVDRRDLEAEDRRDGLENLFNEVMKLKEEPLISGQDYNAQLESIKFLAEQLKK